MTDAAPIERKSKRPNKTELEIRREWAQASFPYLDLKKLSGIFVEFNMPANQFNEFANNLNDARAEYEIHRMFADAPVPSAVRKFLKGSIQKPVNRIAKVAKEMAAEEDALVAQKKDEPKKRPSKDLRYFRMMKAMLSYSFEKWAYKQDAIALQTLGIDPEQIYVAVDHWLDMSILISNQLEELEQHLARLKPGRRKPPLGGDNRDGPKRYLCGTRLRLLYEKFTGDECEPIVDQLDRSVAYQGGVKFIILCLEAMNLPSVGTTTVREYVGEPRPKKSNKTKAKKA